MLIAMNFQIKNFVSVLYSKYGNTYRIAEVVASRAQWRFGMFTVRLQMAIKLNDVK